ncbi:hypothetical protein HUS23_09335 [Ectothiorhodospiraceae bacterium 2226]|nr:hypothetical protein HUS23_09335 [Ectothiorhodospiraceae bacterium 2226]
MKRRWLFLSLLSVWLLSACQALTTREMDVLEGATLTLREPLTFPAGDTRLHIQGGETRSYWRINQYQTHCRLELDGAREQAHTLQPGEFRVARVRYEWDQVQHGEQPVMVAGLGAFAGGGALTSRIEIVVLELDSAEQPEFARVRCMQWMDPQWARVPTLDEVRGALGERFVLELP